MAGGGEAGARVTPVHVSVHTTHIYAHARHTDVVSYTHTHTHTHTHASLWPSWLGPEPGEGYVSRATRPESAVPPGPSLAPAHPGPAPAPAREARPPLSPHTQPPGGGGDTVARQQAPTRPPPKRPQPKLPGSPPWGAATASPRPPCLHPCPPRQGPVTKAPIWPSGFPLKALCCPGFSLN